MAARAWWAATTNAAVPAASRNAARPTAPATHPQRRLRPAVLRIEERSYEFPWTPGNFHDSIRARYSCWVRRNGEGVLSYAVMMLAAGEAHLLNLSVDSALWRRGHGTRLLQHLVATARAQGARMLPGWNSMRVTASGRSARARTTILPRGAGRTRWSWRWNSEWILCAGRCF
jgi:GNAT superfamily N-acetyltransferase